MAVAIPQEEKRIFDASIIESYCKAKYGYRVVNLMGRTTDQEEESYNRQKETNAKWLHIYKVLPVGHYKPIWQHKYDILIQAGLLEKELIEFRQNRLDDLLDS